MRQEFHTFNIDKKVSPIKISEVLELSRFPDNRRGQETKEAIIFGNLLEIWSNRNLWIIPVDEEKTSCKGIDFFLLEDVTRLKTAALAFQMLEYVNLSQKDNIFENLYDWIIRKKFRKGSQNIHLVVSIKSGPVHCNLDSFSNKFEHLPFASISIFGLSENKFILFGIYNKKIFFVEIDKSQIIRKIMECPFFE